MLSRFSHVRLFATPWTVALPGSSVHGSLQAKILEWVAIPSSRECSGPRIKLGSPVLRGFLYPLTHRRSPDNIYLLILCIHNFLMAYKLIMYTCVFACVCVCVNVHTSTHVSFSVQASIWCCDGRKVCVLRKLFL